MQGWEWSTRRQRRVRKKEGKGREGGREKGGDRAAADRAADRAAASTSWIEERIVKTEEYDSRT